MCKNPLTVGGGARLGREGDRPTARDKVPGAGSPSSAIFHCRILRSLRSSIANLTFQGFVKLICQGKKIDHIFFNSVLVKFVALIMQTSMGLHLHSSHVATMLEAGGTASMCQGTGAPNSVLENHVGDVSRRQIRSCKRKCQPGNNSMHLFLQRLFPRVCYVQNCVLHQNSRSIG